MRIITLAIAFLIGTNAQAQIIRAEPFYTAPEEAVSGNLLLDDYGTGQRGAYSLRKLRTAYTGNAIKIRRHSDNAEQDIGFVNNYLDTAAIRSFAGTDTAFVVIIYDQSTIGNNATQSTATQQGRIYQASNFIFLNNKVCIYFDGSNDNYVLNSFTEMHYDSAHTIVAIYSRYGTTSNNRRLFNTGNSTSRIALSASNHYTLSSTTASTGASATSTTDVQYLAFAYNSPQTLYVNNTLATGTSAGAASLNSNRIGDANANNSPFMNFQELIIFNTDKSGDRTGMQSNINSFYSIY